MARVQTQQHSFAGGELSPRLYGRTDVAKYAAGVEALENYIVRPEGGVMRRHGSRFTGEVTQHTKKARLREFIFSNADKIMMVFEDLSLRFYKNAAPITSASNSITGITKANPAVLTYSGADNFANGDRVLVTGVVGMGQVNNREFTVANLNAGANTFELSGVNSSAYDAYSSGGTVSKIYQVTTPYLEADLGRLYFSQSADVVYIDHPSYAPRTLSRASDTSWTLTANDLSKGPFADLNTTDSIRVLCAVTGSAYQPGDAVSLQANSAIFSSSHVGSYFRMQEIYFDQLDVAPWEAGHPIGALYDQKSNDGNVYAFVDTRGSVTGSIPPTHTIGDAWDGVNEAGAGGESTKWRYLHSRWAIIKIDTFTDTKNVSGTIVTYLCNGLAPAAKTITNVVNSGDATALCRVTSVAHGYNDGDYVTVSGVVGATEANGDWKIKNTAANTFDLVGSSAPSAYVSGGTAKRFSTWLWQFGAFSAARGYPACVALHEQRLIHASTSSQPAALWASKTGDYPNFLPGTDDDDAISYNIAAGQADPIRWIASGNDLMLGTLGQEFAAYGGGLGDPITPANTRCVPQSGEGSSQVQPVKVGDRFVFVSRSGTKLFAYGLQPAQESVTPYGVVDLLELANHLTLGKTVTAIAWCKNPASLLWALLSDGSLICATYRPEQQLLAWHRHPITGTVESIAALPSTDGTTDDLWIIVNRTINGSTRRYVEYIAPPFEPTSATDKSGMAYLDAALQYSGASATTLSGLFHLEGQTVKVIGNGALQTDKTVTNGKITIDSAITQGWIGLAYTSRLRTLRLDVPALGGTQGKTKRVPRVSVLVHNAIGGTAGPGTESVMDELVKREADDPMDASPPMRSGWVDFYAATDFDVDGRLAFVQSDPMPLDILSIAPIQSVAD